MVTVADVLGIRRLALEPLVTANPDATVRWVATSELRDPSPFLEGGEVLLTTGLLDRDAAGWQRLARRAVDAGVVAIGFGVGLGHPDVPPPLQAAARRLALNLFSVPREIPFIAVSRAIADLLSDAERDADRQALSHQQSLTSAAVSAGGASAVLDLLAGIVGGDVVLADRRGTMLAEASRRPPAELAREAVPLIARIEATAARSSATDITTSARLTVQPVGSGARIDSYLLVETTAALTTQQRSAVTTAIALLALDRERARAGRDADRRLRAGVLSLVLSGDLRSAESLLAATPPGPGLLWDEAVVVRSRGPVETMEGALTRVEQLGSALDFALAAIVPGSDDGHEPELVVALRHSEEHLSTLLESLSGLQSGVGPACQMGHLADSDHGARDALGFTTASRPVVAWAELAEDGIDSVMNADALRLYAKMLLQGALELPDRDLLIDCLRSYLKHNGKVGPTAQELGVHRNTVSNRVAAVEDALGRSLQSPQIRSDLWIALKYLEPSS